jgi:hypothetical protein
MRERAGFYTTLIRNCTIAQRRDEPGPLRSTQVHLVRASERSTFYALHN